MNQKQEGLSQCYKLSNLFVWQLTFEIELKPKQFFEISHKIKDFSNDLYKKKYLELETPAFLS